MKPLLLFAGVSLAIANAATTKPSPPVKPKIQNAKECSVNVYGSNNSVGNLTCVGIDAALAKEFKEIANGTNRDEKLLTDIRTKLQALIAQVKNSGPTVQAGAGSVISVNQTGGITAGQINISGSSAVAVYFSLQEANQPQPQPDGSVLYKTVIRVSLSGNVPRFTVSVDAQSLTRFNLGPEHGGVTMGTTWPVNNGQGAQAIQNAFGTLLLTAFTKNPERFSLNYQCEGATCIRP